ncbi:MAG: hypothetical protein KDD61_12315 [Bdellovibrionales bacterium]|nr:hypothetical protein [Bdellovibrionales bacterium]
MKRKILTKIQLKQIEIEIDKINARAESLDPENPFDAELLYNDDLKLDEYIKILETSYKFTKIKESGLVLVN